VDVGVGEVTRRAEEEGKDGNSKTCLADQTENIIPASTYALKKIDKEEVESPLP